MIALFDLIRALPEKSCLPQTDADLTNYQVSEVMVMATPDIKEWLIPGELVLTSLFGLNANQQVKLITQLSQFGAAGLMIKTNSYLKEIPKRLTSLGQKLGLPIIKIQAITYRKIIDCFQHLKSEPIHLKESLFDPKAAHLLTNLLSGRGITKDQEVYLSNRHLTITTKLRLVTLLSSRQPVKKLQKLILAVQNRLPEVVMGLRGQYLYILVADRLDWRSLLNEVAAEFSHETFLISGADDLNHVRNLDKQVINMRAFVLAAGSRSRIVSFDELGINRLFIEEKTAWLAKTLAFPQLGTLQKQSPELFESLQSYFLYNQNVTQAAKALYIHPKSLRYRLHKIQTDLGINWHDADQLLWLHLSLKFLALTAKGFEID